MTPQKHIRFDWAIKRLLRNKANFDILEGFLSELLRQDVRIQEILESQSNKRTQNDKYNQVDILVKSTSDELMLIEVQNEKEDDYFQRMNYGQAKLTTEYLFQSERYAKIKKVISINIVYFELGQGSDYIYVGHTNFKGIHNADILQLSEKQKAIYPVKQVPDLFATYYLIKVNNFDENAKDTLDEWIYFLKTSEIKDSFRAKGLEGAKERMRVDNLDKAEKEEYEHYIKHERIRDSEIETANSDGYIKAQKELLPVIEEAKKREEEERKQKEEERKQKEEERKQKEEAKQKESEATQKLVRKMLKYGESVEEIMKETGWSRDEIERIK